MKHKEESIQPATGRPHRSGLLWLLAAAIVLLLLIGAGLHLSPRLLHSPLIKEKITAAMTARTGGHIAFKGFDFSYFPRPEIKVKQVHFDFPDQAQGSIAELAIVPEILPLLRGEVRLVRLELDTATLALTLPEGRHDTPPVGQLILGAIEQGMTGTGTSRIPVSSRSTFLLNDGRLTLRQGQLLAEINGLNLQGRITTTSSRSARVRLNANLNALKIDHARHLTTVSNIKINSETEISADETHIILHSLTAEAPGLQLSGDFQIAPNGPGVALNLAARNLDVAAIRATCLSLAGDSSVVKNIFDYLRAGRVPDISFSTQAKQLSELGDLAGIALKGHLQDGRIAVPEARLDLSEVAGEVTISDGILQGSGLSARLHNSTAKNATLQIGLPKGNDLFALTLAGEANLAELYPWLASLPGLHDQLTEIQQVSGSAALSTLTLKGDLDQPAKWDISATGSLKDLRFTTKLLPERARVASGQFQVKPQQLSFNALKVACGDGTATLSGTVRGELQHPANLKLTLNADVGETSFAWLRDTLDLPDEYIIRTPFGLTDTEISWQPESPVSFTGQIDVREGPTITAIGTYSPGHLEFSRLTVKDQYSDAVMALELSSERRYGKLSGRLQYQTLQNLFIEKTFDSGQLEGDMAVTLPAGKQAAAAGTGRLTGDNLPISLPSGEKVAIDHLLLNGQGSIIGVDISKLTWQGFSWMPLKANLSYRDGKALIQVNEARLCGIDAPGSIAVHGDNLTIDMTLTGQDLDVGTSYNCLTRGTAELTGKLDFSSDIKVQAQTDRLVQNMQGPLHMTFTGGEIKHHKLLSRVLEVLNVTEIFKGRLPNLNSTGFAYKTVTLNGRFHDGSLTIDNFFMDGETLDLIGEGEINLMERSLKMQLLAAPFQTIDTIIKHLPGVNYLLAGTLVSIPVSITGPLNNPKVQILSAKAVSSSLLNFAKRTIESPIKLLDTIKPWKKEKE